MKVFSIGFDVPGGQVGPTPQHAPLFAHVIGELVGEDMVACMSMNACANAHLPLDIVDSDVTYLQLGLVEWLVYRQLTPRGLWHFALLVDKSTDLPGVHRHIFFECPRDLTGHYFQEYLHRLGTVGFEGYVLPRDSIPLLVEWNLQKRDAALFHKVMDTVFAAFHTFADNEGIEVITRRLDFEGFKRRIRLGELMQLAASLSVEEQRPYWRMLEELDQFTYRQSLKQLPDLCNRLEISLCEVETDDAGWVQRFREAWSQFEQAYQTPLYTETYSIRTADQTCSIIDLDRIFASLDEMKGLLRAKISSLGQSG